MEEINIVMLMGGNGSRVRSDAYFVPKPLIMLGQYPMFFWTTKSLIKAFKNDKLTFVILKDHANKFHIREVISTYVPCAQYVQLNYVLNGPVFSALEGIKFIDNCNPVVFSDCDLAFMSNNIQSDIKRLLEDDLDGMLLAFKSKNPNYSYVKVNEKNNAIHIEEKKVISTNAICGVYIFKNKGIFIKYAEVVKQIKGTKECYMSDVMSMMIRDEKKIGISYIEKHFSFGTLDEIEKLNLEKLQLALGD